MDDYTSDVQSAASVQGAVRRRKPVFLIILVILLALLCGAVAGGYLLRGYDEQNRPVVPTVVGLNEIEAKTLLQDAGFNSKIQSDYSDAVEAGAVTAQSVAGRAQLGSVITLSVSMGEQTAAVPDVSGMTAEDAKAALAEVGFLSTVTEEYSSKAEVGAVMAQKPEAGSDIRPGGLVTLTVSKGEEPSVVPNVSGMALSEASAVLENKGYSVTYSEIFDTADEGIVASQRPAAGHALEQGKTVDLSVSIGEAMVEIPDLSGMDYREAANELVALGLTYTFDYQSSSSVKSGCVISQTPKAGMVLQEGSNVFYYVSE